MVQNRLLGADFLRALGCMAVIFHHLIFKLDLSQAPQWIRPLLSYGTYGSFGVAVFFVLSGFLLARPFWVALDKGEPMPSLRVYAMRRAARIIPGFWLALIVTFVLSITLFGVALDGRLVTRLVAGLMLVSDWHWLTLFPVEGNGPLWSIGFEVSSYVFLPMCLFLLFLLPGEQRRPVVTRSLWVGVIVAVLVLHWLVTIYAPIDDVERGWDYGIVGGAKSWMPSFNPIGFFAIFAMGALASGLQVLVSARRSVVFDVIALIAIIGAAVVLWTHVGQINEGFGFLNIPYGFPVFPSLLAVFLASAPSSVWLGQAWDTRPVRYIARVSFGLYVWHFLIIGLVQRLVPLAFDNRAEGVWGNWLLASGGVLVLSFAVATASFYWLEDPVVKWAKRLEGARRVGDRVVV